ncbi:zinc finger containing protein, putative [Babesia ovis]|uniref:Zinc finger containing protein, putative n=1 Tax=Babesia ovis TaxID=5869 RepID=A0A9W5TFA2_BABOV|nr:zinc finger containing protein, putative [Babesia ovis]
MYPSKYYPHVHEVYTIDHEVVPELQQLKVRRIARVKYNLPSIVHYIVGPSIEYMILEDSLVELNAHKLSHRTVGLTMKDFYTTHTENSTGSNSTLEVTREGNIAGFRDALIYETIRLSDCHYDEALKVFYYMCPCGDLFEFSLTQLMEGNLVSECPSCSLRVRIALEEGDLEPYKE